MDLDSRAYSKLINENNTYGGSEEYIRILDAILPLTKDVITKHQKCGALVFVIHLGKYLKRIQESFLRMDIL